MDQTITKMEKDWSAETSAGITKAKTQPYKEGIESLLILEKQTRLSADLQSNTLLLKTIVELCHQNQDYKLMEEYITVLMKKRGLLKAATTQMIQLVISLLDSMKEQTRIEMIEAIRTICDGKIFVEVERARVTMMLSKMKEAKGQIQESCDLLNSLQVETYTSMSKREKTDFILHQVRLLLQVKDLNRASIISRKISTRYFEEKNTTDLKIRYLHLMIHLAKLKNETLGICKYYKELFDTVMKPKPASSDEMQTDEEETVDVLPAQEILKRVVVFAVLAPFDNHQSDLVHRISKIAELEPLSVYKDLLTTFTTPELIEFTSFETTYKQEIVKVLDAECITTDKKQETEKYYTDLMERIVQKNLRTIGGYYQRITMSKLSKLVQLSIQETEKHLCSLIISGQVVAKVDRITQTITFGKSKTPEATLNEFKTTIDDLLSLVMKTKHLIQKEEMVHGITKVAV